MPDPLTPEEKKARRAEINRQNSKKSTGPKTDAGPLPAPIPETPHPESSSP